MEGREGREEEGRGEKKGWVERGEGVKGCIINLLIIYQLSINHLSNNLFLSTAGKYAADCSNPEISYLFSKTAAAQ